MSLQQELKTGHKKLGVWGLGYIGFSSIAHFAKAGVSCIGTDPVQRRVDDVNEGKATITNLAYWLGFDTIPLARDGRMRATTDWKELIHPDVAVHLIAVPTEMNGKPFHDILKDVIQKISLCKHIQAEHPPLVIVESTLTPTIADSLVIPLFEENGLKVGKDILLGVAPRRDWFTAADKGLNLLPRVVGGTTKETTDLMAGVVGIICQNVLKAPDHKHAAMVKSIENAYRHLDITFANQLSLAYPDMNMTSILQLVGTKWNVNTYHPSFGIGGYCLPLAPQYVLEGARHPERLTLLQEAVKSDFSHPEKVVRSLLLRGVKNVGILGIAYTGDLKVHVLSPALPIARKLKEAGVDVKVHDPYYSAEELTKLTGCQPMSFPQGLEDRDCILLVSPHMHYKYVHKEELHKSLANVSIILDNMGTWNDLSFPERIQYFEAGQAHWLG